jgi:site-specific DNA-methyltransferase (adenine-specific)
MVRVDMGDWDKIPGGRTKNHNFNREWLARASASSNPTAPSGHRPLHVIFSIGFAMQQLGFKILNDIAWEKPNPPPNLSCRYFTHSTETISLGRQE